MIQALANCMASYVVKNDETADQEVLAYGYGLIITAIVTYTVVITSALFFGMFREMIIAIGSYMLMRATVGGCHAGHRAVCFISYSGILYACIILAGSIIVNWPIVLVLYLVNVVLLVLYAPGDTVEQPIVRYRFEIKILVLLFLSCLFSTYIFFPHMSTEVNIMMFISTSTCVLLHPLIYKMYGCTKSSHNE